MKVLTGIRDLSTTPRALCIGNFDGMHRGHKAVVREMVVRASGMEKVVLSFRPHPMEVLYPKEKFSKIQQWSERPILLQEYGVDILVLQPFTKSFTQLKPEEFLLDWLIPNTRPHLIVVGEGFNFGCGQAGNVDFLKHYETKYHFEVVSVSNVIHGGVQVSSTVIRKLLSQGSVFWARYLLGHPYFLEGHCQKGEGRGSQFGVPTLNIPLEENLAICSGVYACHLIYNKIRYLSVANLGRAPTFHRARGPVLEVHTLSYPPNFAPDEKIRVELIWFLRKEKKFSNQDDLIVQIKKDVHSAKMFFVYSSDGLDVDDR